MMRFLVLCKMFIQGGAWILMSSCITKHLHNIYFFIKNVKNFRQNLKYYYLLYIVKIIKNLGIYRNKRAQKLLIAFFQKKKDVLRRKNLMLIVIYIICLKISSVKIYVKFVFCSYISQPMKSKVIQNLDSVKTVCEKSKFIFNKNMTACPYLFSFSLKKKEVIIKGNKISYNIINTEEKTLFSPFNKNNRTTILSKHNKVKIICRNYPGGKEVGHATKVLNSISKKPAMEVLSQTPTHALRTASNSTPAINLTNPPENKVLPTPTTQSNTIPISIEEQAAQFHRDTNNAFHSEKVGKQESLPSTEHSNTTYDITQIINSANEGAPYTPGAYLKENSPKSLSYVFIENEIPCDDPNKVTAIITEPVVDGTATSENIRDNAVSSPVEKPTEFSTQSIPNSNEKNPFEGNLTVEDVFDVGFKPIPPPTMPVPAPKVEPSKYFGSPEFKTELHEKATEIEKTSATATQIIDNQQKQKNQENIKISYLIDKYLNTLPLEDRIIAERWYLSVMELEKISPININVLLLELEKRGLLTWGNSTVGRGLGSAKLTAKFFALYKEVYSTPTEPLTDDLLNNSTISAVLLSCNPDSALLDGLQTHVAIMATTAEGIRYIIGYLTSQKDGNFILADTQELINNKDKGQYIHYLSVAKKITDDSQIQEVLSRETEYLNQKKHLNIIKENLKSKMPNSVENYANIKIFSAEEIKKIIEISDEKSNDEKKKELKTYIEKGKQAKNKYRDNIEQFFEWKEKYDKGKSAQLGYEWPPKEFQGF